MSHASMVISACAFNRSIATHILYIVPEIMCSLSGILSVAIIVYSFFLYGFRLLFHYNAKILMILLTIFILIFSLDIVYVCTRQIYLAFSYENDCDLVFETASCSIFRRIALTCFVGVTTTQFCQMFERLIATVAKEKYEFQTQWLGGLLVFFSILSAILAIEWTLWNEDPLEPMTHCLVYSTSASIGERMYIVFLGILVVDIFILAVFLALYQNNKRKILSSGLNKKYQQHENLVVLRALFPMVLLNTVFVSAYILIAMVVRAFRDSLSLTNYKFIAINTFIFPYVSLLLSMTILVTTRNEFQRRQLRELNQNGKGVSQTYFNLYQRQWSVISERK
ncbi:G_PROTEIN_RECEP_F1_2 domain-containing protein [Caenorhabditis elegans]|uniref:G_PROTEIN_RECEP_F1_2 domain-containing protein n=1 Tax=Caenorhabditis elegans TaxID=6239 RepID=B1Q258_CAEEL|nr:G_PROTEIN_RECEP_F1_2 domain-containing protein [Caenorhabditis elegans]CAQ16149.1 G_PROTEIN_RECEP_F1_2 domain-containing protein [Caenorhabditis elegans]|eukprot:NP_001123166.1 Uncharacterized protein CELE_K11E4.6 [Caenorhabditis elegans]